MLHLLNELSQLFRKVQALIPKFRPEIQLTLFRKEDIELPGMYELFLKPKSFGAPAMEYDRPFL